MDQIDHQWLEKSARNSCPQLTHREYEIIVDQLENASTRTLISLDEARILFASATPSINNELHIKTVYDFWHQRRTAQVDFLRSNIIEIHGDFVESTIETVSTNGTGCERRERQTSSICGFSTTDRKNDDEKGKNISIIRINRYRLNGC